MVAVEYDGAALRTTTVVPNFEPSKYLLPAERVENS